MVVPFTGFGKKVVTVIGNKITFESNADSKTYSEESKLND